MTDAVVVSVPEFGLASVAARAAAGFAPTGAQSARAAAPATRVFLSGLVLIVAARAVAVVSGPAAVAAGFAAVFALAAFPLDRAFALPAVVAALRPQCQFPPMTGC